MVWVYGGAFQSGSSSLYGYTGDILAAAGVVVVSFNYRLGVFGWGAFQPSEGAPSNVGLLDQQAALQWVQDNIAAFGGDRARVTLFGESAGAISISLHSVIASSQSLFAQTILESGTAMQGLSGPNAISTYDFAAQHKLTSAIFGAANCTSIACARALPMQTLLDTQQAILAANPGVSFFPVIDGVLLAQEPLAILYAQRNPANRPPFGAKPTMSGNVLDEGTMFVPGGDVDLVTSALVSNFLTLKFGSALAASILATYPLDPVVITSPGYQIAATITDQFFTCPCRRVLAALESSGSGVYMWNFAHRPSWINGPQVKLRVAHTSEMWFVFGHSPAPSIAFTAAEQQLSAQMRAAWVQFATTGRAPWPAWSAASKAFQMFNTSDGGGARLEHDFRGAQCDFWDAITSPAAPGAAPDTGGGIGAGAIAVISVLSVMLAGLVVYYFVLPKRMRCWDPESLKSPAFLDADHVAYGEMN